MSGHVYKEVLTTEVSKNGGYLVINYSLSLSNK